MSYSDVASLIAAGAFALLVIFLAVPLLRLGAVFRQLQKSVAEITEQSVPIIKEASGTVSAVNTQVEKLDEVTNSAQRAVQDVSALTTLTSATLGKPLIKISAFTYATRKALNLVPKDDAIKGAQK